MARFMMEATADRRQDIERWEKDLIEASAAGNSDLAEQIRRRIGESRKIIDDSGYRFKQ
jgi:hypothetical protein